MSIRRFSWGRSARSWTTSGTVSGLTTACRPPSPFANCPVPIAALDGLGTSNCPSSTAKHLSTGETVDIIPIDTVSRTVRHNAQYSGTLTGGLVQQRFIHHGYATTDRTLYVRCERMKSIAVLLTVSLALALCGCIGAATGGAHRRRWPTQLDSVEYTRSFGNRGRRCCLRIGRGGSVVYEFARQAKAAPGTHGMTVWRVLLPLLKRADPEMWRGYTEPRAQRDAEDRAR